MSTLSERISWLQSTYNLSQSELARIAGVSQPSVAHWLNGKTSSIRAEAAVAICKKLPVMYEWLLAGVGDPLPKATPVLPLITEEIDDDSDFVKIPVYTIQCSAGDGYTPPTYTIDETAEPKSYRRSWLQKHQYKQSHLKVFEVSGESMEPLLFDGDSVTVDEAQRDIINDRVYVFTYRGEWRVKRLRRLMNGDLYVVSENLSWKPEVIPATETEFVYIVGRVIDRSGAGGL